MTNLFIYNLMVLLISVIENVDSINERLDQARSLHKHVELTSKQISKLAHLSDTRDIDEILDSILIERVVGTRNHDLVGDYIINKMKSLGWTVEEDIFNDHTPTHGLLQFRNIIAKLDPDADRYLILACHYDSKYTPGGYFEGAIDSAVPCAMLLNLAKVMNNILKNKLGQNDVSLVLVFFDGEEAFRQWGPKDSIYGARHLANSWDKSSRKLKNGDVATELEKIDMLVLLDLLGTPDPKFYNYFGATTNWYTRLMHAEEQLSKLRALTRYSNGRPEQKYFQPISSHSQIEDDHIPFLKKGVKIVHLIPTPFPPTWHTEKDNRQSLDIDTIENLNKILRVFVAEYLEANV